MKTVVCNVLSGLWIVKGFESCRTEGVYLSGM